MEDKFIAEHYNVVKMLGKGAFGKVYLVTKLGEDKLIALKKITIEKDKKESLETKLQKVEDEINMMKEIANPKCSPYMSCYIGHHIIKNGRKITIYLEMEYVKGQSIDKYILPFREENDTPNMIKIAFILIKYICSALEILHQKNILHEDIKPENIIIDDETLIPVLVDFGLSCVTKPKGEGDCVYDKCCKNGGTVEFMAPERLTHNSKVAYPKSDVWSLGATIFYLITGFHNRDTRMINNSSIEKLDTENKLLNKIVNGMTDIDINTRYDIDFILKELQHI